MDDKIDNLEELLKLSESRIDLQFSKEALKTQEKYLNSAIKDIDEQITKILKAGDLKKFVHARGTISLQEKESVKVPQSPENKRKLMEWLKSENIYDDYVTVNSQSINALHKKYKSNLLDEAKQQGNKSKLKEALNFSIPGIEQPAPYEVIKLTNKKPSESN